MTAGTALMRVAQEPGGARVLALSGRLDTDSTGAVWRSALAEAKGGGELVVDASALEYCDGAGASLLVALREEQERAGGRFAVRGLRDDTRRLIELVSPKGAPRAARAPRRESLVVATGRRTLEYVAGFRTFVTFVGELAVLSASALRHPRTIRTRDVFGVAEQAGIGAVPIIALVGFLLGLILSFQSAVPMQRFGAQIFVADLLGISMTRVLAGLMTAVLLTARSGSAFAAELGTMKVNEEIDALTTMGLEPVRFLVVPRVIAAVGVVPTLTMVMLIASLAGGLVMFLSLGFPPVTYLNRLSDAVHLVDLAQGLFKSLVFGVVVAAVGCLRGLQAGKGAGAVGASATSAVVSGIVLIAVLEGLFSITFYVMGI
jgi:phospholipid/cholesterol/gamma-HCH transport system permease protein